MTKSQIPNPTPPLAWSEMREFFGLAAENTAMAINLARSNLRLGRISALEYIRPFPFY